MPELPEVEALAIFLRARAGGPVVARAEVSFADSSLQYSPACQAGGKPLAARRLSRLLK